MKAKLFVLLGVVPIALVLLLYAATVSRTRGSLDFKSHLDSIAAIVDGEDITLRDLIFYVLFEEQKIESQARIYNPDSPKDYWNAHTNGAFIQAEAKEYILEMAIHDKILFDLATEAHVVLSSAQKQELEEARTKFWSSLYEEQLEKLPYDYETGNKKMREIAVVEAFMHSVAATYPDVTFAGLGWDGYDYAIIKADHKIKIHKRIWDRVVVGDISLTHDNVNYINGLTDEDKERMKEERKR